MIMAFEQLEVVYKDEAERLRKYKSRERTGGEYLDPVFGAGDPTRGIVFLGEAPGAEETRDGCPFVGRAGKNLSFLLDLMGVKRDDVYLTNVIKFRPLTFTAHGSKNRTPTTREVIDSCVCLEKELKILQPKLVVTLGNTPLAAIARLSGILPPKIGDVHGKPSKITLPAGLCELFPLYHPASGIYNRSLLTVMQDDAEKLGEHLVKLR